MMHSHSLRRTGCGLWSAPELSFFDARKMRSNRWFFEIYIQGSKYNFLELSLKLTSSEGKIVRAESFSYQMISGPREGPEQIDQATKST